ncbi:hypothetical protein [Streptomyces sp. WAC 01438]|uniref:hypothetical protein n=1 Tax=Streptomyces sp. WAC 01438 TaxID=2203204 RepID=UPI000F6CBACF|nr:hypothetical protein [Streptomyces sp. WAC 01438]AZM61399.1 hypothetical protein DLM49_19320 [Streptomyces sp. WAC 01438]
MGAGTTWAQGAPGLPCIGVLGNANFGALAGVVPVAVEDIPIVSNPQLQQCPENSTLPKVDEPISNVLQDLGVFSAGE